MSDATERLPGLWRDQPRTAYVLALDEIRSRAARFERTVRNWNIATVAVCGVMVVVEAVQVLRGDRLLERIGDTLTAAALLYVAVVARRHISDHALPAGLGVTGSVEFYRSELEQRRDRAMRPWHCLALFMPGVALSLFGRVMERTLAANIAVAIVGVGLFVAVAALQRRTGRLLQQEIDELG